jgi:hypothetical protein
VKATTLHRSDFVQQNAANTKTNLYIYTHIYKEREREREREIHRLYLILMNVMRSVIRIALIYVQTPKHGDIMFEHGIFNHYFDLRLNTETW